MGDTGKPTVRRARPDEIDSCVAILRSLPDWFGIEEAIEAYAMEMAELPTYIALDDDQIAGFLSLDIHNPYTAEIHVLGVRSERHRRGIGTALVAHAEALARARGCEFLEVKTLGPSRPHEPYERTRAFYLARGFRPLEELHDLWPGNPCLIMVKHLDALPS